MDKTIQEQSLVDELERATAFEELIRTRGWQYIKAYYENLIRTLASELLLQENKPIIEFEKKRNELIGLKKVFGQIESSLVTLENYRKEQRDKRDKQKSR